METQGDGWRFRLDLHFTLPYTKNQVIKPVRIRERGNKREYESNKKLGRKMVQGEQNNTG